MPAAAFSINGTIMRKGKDSGKSRNRGEKEISTEEKHHGEETSERDQRNRKQREKAFQE